LKQKVDARPTRYSRDRRLPTMANKITDSKKQTAEAVQCLLVSHEV
jgi:hypothetical protein